MRLRLLFIFSLSYVGISARYLRWIPVGRPSVALIGACISVGFSVWAGPPFLTFDEALAAIELHTLSLLFGMMLLAAGLAESVFLVG